MQQPSEMTRRAASWKGAVAGAVLAALAAAPQAALAGEGGISHVVPGATATLIDFPGTSAAWFVKPMFLNYSGSESATLPTAAGLAANLDATANTFVLVGGRTFADTVLGGAHYTFAVAVPYAWQDVSADLVTPRGILPTRNEVSGLGDVTVVPLMLAWKRDEWQFDATVPIFTPTGSYEKGRLGNPGLNYWTFDPTVGAVYSNKSGFAAALHVGYAINTGNSATDYKSGSVLHFEGVVQQTLPAGSGFLQLGAEGFYFDQVTCDSGAGATLGCFKGRTAGVGPVLGYVAPLGKETLILEFKWLPELETKKRVEGDYFWLKMVYKF